MSIAGENTLCRARITTRDSLTCTYICINIRCILYKNKYTHAHEHYRMSRTHPTRAIRTYRA